MKELAKDQIREGVVKNITDFGAFVDLGGIDGLLHITDMSWAASPSLRAGQDRGQDPRQGPQFRSEKERISLGLKQLTYPWEGVAEKYPPGTKVRGTSSITDHGAFVELEKGAEGLIHVSEIPDASCPPSSRS
jgi:small subunit ribosomal protein S1